MSEMTVQEEDLTVRESSSVEGRLIMPFWLICDVSGSMHKDVGELTQAVGDLITAIQKDPVVDDLVRIGIIAFSNSATTLVPLSTPSAITAPTFSAHGGTNYSAAFTEFHNTFDAERNRLKGEGAKVYRPCVFFLTDGEPTDSAYLETFRKLFHYDPNTKQGNRAFPYFVPIGFRSAREDVLKQLAYPDFGRTRGRWFIFRNSGAAQVLKLMTDSLGKSIVSSGQSASIGTPQIVAPEPPPGVDAQFGDAGDFM